MANTVYANKVLEAKAKDLLTTSINTRNLMAVDEDLVENAGMTKTINTYTYAGEAEELANGVGNTTAKRGNISYTSNDYTVKMVQQAFDYTDEDFMKDPSIVDNMLKGATQVMVNKMTTDFFTEAAKASKSIELSAGISYDAIVDAISELNLEDESQIFVIIPNAWKADLRKDVDYKSARQGEVIYNGQVGTICGIPVIASKAATEGYVMTKEAIKLFMKKDVEVEQDRNADTRTNSTYLRAAYVVALVDATKICKLTKEVSA